MRLRVAVLFVSANFFAPTYVAIPIGHPGLLGTHADGPGQRRLGRADNGNLERGIFAEVVNLQADVTLDLIAYLKNALDRAHHHWARWNLPRQHRVILNRFMKACALEDKSAVDTIMSSFTKKAISSTIFALKRVDDPGIQAIAERMQSKQLDLWRDDNIKADDLFEHLGLENILSERLKDPKFGSLADSPEFAIWAAYVTDSWETIKTDQPKQLEKAFGAIKRSLTGYKGKAMSLQKFPIDNKRDLQLNLRKPKITLIVKRSE